MPTNTWETPPMQSDTDARVHQAGTVEPGNFESGRGDDGGNPDASIAPEHGRVDYDEINFNGSER